MQQQHKQKQPERKDLSNARRKRPNNNHSSNSRNNSNLSLCSGGNGKVAPAASADGGANGEQGRDLPISGIATLSSATIADNKTEENPLSSFAAALALKHRKRSRLNRSLRTSRALTPASALAALAALVASLLTPRWLWTLERMPNLNRTVLWGPEKSPEYLEKLSHSGLFQLCATAPGDSEYVCLDIDYFPEESYQPDQQDATMAIPYAVINSAWFFFCSFGLMLAASVLCVFGMAVARAKLLTFVAGIAFIVSGLLLFVGQIVYISILKGEMGNKLLPMSMLSPPRLSYHYGWSFFMLVASFLACEAAGVSAISLFLLHHQYNYVCKQSLREGLTQRVDLDGKVICSNSFGNAFAAAAARNGHVKTGVGASRNNPAVNRSSQDDKSSAKNTQSELKDKDRKVVSTISTVQVEPVRRNQASSQIGNGSSNRQNNRPNRSNSHKLTRTAATSLEAVSPPPTRQSSQPNCRCFSSNISSNAVPLSNSVPSFYGREEGSLTSSPPTPSSPSPSPTPPPPYPLQTFNPNKRHHCQHQQQQRHYYTLSAGCRPNRRQRYQHQYQCQHHPQPICHHHQQQQQFQYSSCSCRYHQLPNSTFVPPNSREETCFNSLLSPHSCPGDRSLPPLPPHHNHPSMGQFPLGQHPHGTTYQFQGHRHRCGNCGYSYESLVAFGGTNQGSQQQSLPSALPPHQPSSCETNERRNSQHQHSRLGRRHHLRAPTTFSSGMSNAATSTHSRHYSDRYEL